MTASDSMDFSPFFSVYRYCRKRRQEQSDRFWNTLIHSASWRNGTMKHLTEEERLEVCICCRYQTHSEISPPTFNTPPPPTFLQWSAYGDHQNEDLCALPKMQVEHTRGRDWQLWPLLPESPWEMRIRRFSEPLSVASQLHCVPVSGRSLSGNTFYFSS